MPGHDTSKPFIVKGTNALPALKHWLKERGCNAYSFSRDDIINVGHDSAGGKYSPRGYILLKDKSLFDATRAEIEKAYGWKRDAA